MEFFDEFKEWYFLIIKDFKFDIKKDYLARDYLSKIIKRKRNWTLESTLSSFTEDISKKRYLLIYGCGISLEITIDYLLKNFVNLNDKKVLNVAADGASKLLKERNIKIGATFSDLDGITDNEFNYPDYMIIHAHGDNIDKLEKFESQILEFENIIFTCQVEPEDNILNPGGFTDGDRILFFLRPIILPFQKIFLIGMDFSDKVGKYSKPTYQQNYKAKKNKEKKLNYAGRLIDWIGGFIDNEIYYVNSQAPSQNYINLGLDKFLKTIQPHL